MVAVPIETVTLETVIDLSTPETTAAEQALAWVLILAGLGVTLYFLYRTHYAGLPAQLKNWKADLRGARADTTLQSVYLPRRQARDEARVARAIDRIFDGLEDPNDRANTSLRGAADSVYHQLAETWAPYLLRLSPTVRKVLGLAAVLSVFGFLAVSTEVLLGAMDSSPPTMQPHKWPVLAVTEPTAAAVRVTNLLGALPGVGWLWTVVVVLGLTVGTWFYTHWYVLAGVLAGAAWWLHHVERDLDSARDTRWLRRLPRPGQVARVIIVGVAIIWGATALVIGVGRLAGPNDRAITWGLYALVATTGFIGGLVGLAVWRNRSRLAAIPDRYRTATPAQRRYLRVRTATLALATVASPFVPIYAGVALTKTPELVAAYLAAARTIQAVGALVGMVIAVVLAWQAQAAWGDVSRAIRITAARQSVRSLAAARGVPYIVVVVSYILFAGLSNSIVVGVVVAVALGVLTREGVTLLTRARYRVSLRESRDEGAARVVLEGAPLETRDGDRQWYLRVNGGTELLHPDRDRLIADAQRVVTSLADDGTEVPTIAEWHARYAFEDGTTDPEETKGKLWETVRRELFRPLRDHGGQIPVEYIDEELGEYPAVVVDERLDHEEYTLGTIARTDEYVRLRDDPYSRISA